MPLPATVVVDGNSLRVEDLVAVARHGATASLTEDSAVLRLVEESRRFYLESGILAYGDGLGVGANVGKILPQNKRKEFQVKLTDALNCGMGRELPAEISRGAMLLRANSLLKDGCSAIGLDKIQKLIELLNADVVPVMYEDGSVCASGDLVPLASIARVVQGEGRVWHKRQMREAGPVFAEIGLQKLALEEKEGLAMVNGTSVSAAMAALAIYDAEYLVRLSILCEALGIEALGGLTDHLDPFVHRVKNHPSQALAAALLSDCVAGSGLTHNIDELRGRVSASAAGATQVVETDIELQDPYCLRCSAQLLGPTLELLEVLLRPWFEREMNSANDNPIVNARDRRVYHTGNFAGFYLALGLDILKLAMFNVADLLHALKTRLLNEKYNRGLGASLAGVSPGLNSGMKGLDIATTDIFGKICFLAAPMSIHRRGTESYNQDVVSFGFGAAKYALELNEEFRRLLAAVLVIAVQAVDLRLRRMQDTAAALAPRTRKVYERIRKAVPFLEEDRPLHDDLAAVGEMLRGREVPET